jgi:predicted Fe-Mo cluster-binding NifX family protein
MKIVITAQEPSLESPLDPRFGRARYFIVFDTETEQWEAKENEQNLQAAQGAGIQAAQQVAALGANAVITGHTGPKAFRVLSAAEIPVYASRQESVAQAVEALQKGSLTAMPTADVEGHWV